MRSDFFNRHDFSSVGPGLTEDHYFEVFIISMALSLDPEFVVHTCHNLLLDLFSSGVTAFVFFFNLFFGQFHDVQSLGVTLEVIKINGLVISLIIIITTVGNKSE